mmetsp:Transcript_174/g.458  ORF Transcript_174/g.458 Transcript_174/m.458 type:complete len:222 (-) Transcript_174:267-932(-)
MLHSCERMQARFLENLLKDAELDDLHSFLMAQNQDGDTNFHVAVLIKKKCWNRSLRWLPRCLSQSNWSFRPEDDSSDRWKTILQIARGQIPSFSSCALSIEQATSPVQRDKVLQKKRPSIIDQLYLLSHLRKLDLSDAKRCALTKHHLSSSSMKWVRRLWRLWKSRIARPIRLSRPLKSPLAFPSQSTHLSSHITYAIRCACDTLSSPSNASNLHTVSLRI